MVSAVSAMALVIAAALGVVTESPLGAAPAGARCAASKMNAAGGAAAGAAGCYARALAKGAGVDGTCLAKKQAKLAAAFDRVERRGGCGTNGDAGAIGAMVEAFVDAVAGGMPSGVNELGFGASRDGAKCVSAKIRASGTEAAGKLG